MSVVEFVAAMPDVVRIERPTKVDWLLLLAKKGKCNSAKRTTLKVKLSGIQLHTLYLLMKIEQHGFDLRMDIWQLVNIMRY